MSASDDDRLARAALSRLGEPGELRLTSLVAELGAVALHRHLLADTDLEGLQTDVAVRLAGADPARDLERAASRGIRFVVPGDAEWPAQVDALVRSGSLHERGGVPVGLWVRGPVRLDELERSVGVVGTRNATSYGSAVAGEIGATAAGAGFAVVSGGAFGIDAAAHRGALTSGATVAVLASGVDVPYPRAHADLFDHLARHGAVVSEAPPGCAAQSVRFLARNRLIAGLSRGTVVVEAAIRSGSLNTANWARRIDRTVMGVPGPVTSEVSAGVHEELRQGAMSLVTCGEEVLELVADAGEHLVAPRRSPDLERDRLSTRQRQVLDAVPVSSAAGSDSIARVAGLGILEVRRTLARLEEAELVQRDDAGWRLAARARG